MAISGWEMGWLEVRFLVGYWKMAGWLVKCVFEDTVSDSSRGTIEYNQRTGRAAFDGARRSWCCAYTGGHGGPPALATPGLRVSPCPRDLSPPAACVSLARSRASIAELCCWRNNAALRLLQSICSTGARRPSCSCSAAQLGAWMAPWGSMDYWGAGMGPRAPSLAPIFDDGTPLLALRQLSVYHGL